MTHVVDITERLTDFVPDTYSCLEPYRKRVDVPAARRCGRPKGSLYTVKSRIVYRLGCGRWSCSPCARRKAAALARRFAKILWRRAPALVTLTAARVEDADPTPEAMRRLARRVGSFRRWVARHYGRFQWAWVREVAEHKELCVCHELRACRCGTGGGRLHVHMLWDARYVPQKALSQCAERCHLGSVIDVRRVSAERAARYVAKYLAKSLGHPAFQSMRRFAIRAIEPEREPSDWTFTIARPALVAFYIFQEEIASEADGWCSLNKGAV